MLTCVHLTRLSDEQSEKIMIMSLFQNVAGEAAADVDVDVNDAFGDFVILFYII